MFTLAVICLTTSNLPWFMDLTFQVPKQYCSLQHWTLLLSPVTSTRRCCFYFGSVSSLFLELFLHSSPAAYWCPHFPTWEVHFSVSYIFAFSYCSWCSQAWILKWLAIPFSTAPCFFRTLHHDSSILVVLHVMAHSFIELEKAVWSMWSVWLVFCDCGFHSVCPLRDNDKRFMEASWWERLTVGETGSCLMGGATLSKSLIQFSVDGRVVFPPCCLTWDQNWWR